MRKAALAVFLLAMLLALRDLAWAPKDVSVDKFRALSGWRRQLVKHRIFPPPSYAKTTVQALAAGAHPVGAGVEVEGVVTGVFGSPDGDYCFDLGDVQVELKPEWRLLHRGPLPQVGQKVRVRGWTFYDITHDDEPVYDPAHPGARKKRASFWEVHPALEVDVLREEPRPEPASAPPAGCAGEGQKWSVTSDGKACCPGLVETSAYRHDNPGLACDASLPPGNYGYCVKCGDGRCDAGHWESKCECAADCAP